MNLTSSFSLLDYFYGDYRVYTSTELEDSLNLGFCYMSNSKAQKNVVGESLKINNFEPVSALKTLKAKMIKTEHLEDGTTVLYAYTNLIDKTVEVENKKVNLQIACKDDFCVIGWPLILGSFWFIV